MADLKKTVKRSKTDDLRRVETHVQESVEGAATERVTTVKEEVIPMAVTKVVRELIVPVVTSRKVESYEDGKVVATEHEVVPDEALHMSEYESRMTSDEIAKAVEDAIRRSLPVVVHQPAPVALEVEPEVKLKTVRATMDEKHGSFKNGFEFEFNSDIILYGIVAIEAAAIVYLTILKGWVLN